MVVISETTTRGYTVHSYGILHERIRWQKLAIQVPKLVEKTSWCLAAENDQLALEDNLQMRKDSEIVRLWNFQAVKNSFAGRAEDDFAIAGNSGSFLSGSSASLSFSCNDWLFRVSVTHREVFVSPQRVELKVIA